MALQQEQDPSFIISELNARVRSIEGKYNLMAERLLVVNQNMIEEYKKLIREIRLINSDIKDLKSEIFSIKEALKNAVREIETFAKKEEVKVLEKYIELWNPLNFITEDELNKILDEKLKLKSPKQKPTEKLKKLK